MRPRARLALCALLALACQREQRPLDPGTESRLWGVDGDRWDPASQLPDFSHAGYHAGRDPLPDVPVAANVKDYGAVGDGVSDDTRAFLDALEDMEQGALYVPPGRYVINDVLRLERSGIVLRGAGRGQTTLFFPKSLFEILGTGRVGGPFGWSWGGGLVWARGELDDASALTQVTAPAQRGDRSLKVASTADIETGDRVRLLEFEADGDLALSLHGGHTLGAVCPISRPGFRTIDWVAKVEKTTSDHVQLDRPLRVDVRPRWKPELRPFRATVSEVGVEHLTIEFPLTDYLGHHKEPGLNAIYFETVSDSWVRDVRVHNFDSGVVFFQAFFSTADGLSLTGRGGHYGLNLGSSQDSLMTNFVIENESFHDLSVSNLANGNVFSRGKGPRLNFDHHRNAPYENLFSDIDVGKSWRNLRIWRSSLTPSGHYTAARETFWNIRPQVRTTRLPDWPEMLVIGALYTEDQPLPSGLGRWIEQVPDLEPADLHSAQRKKRWGTTW